MHEKDLMRRELAKQTALLFVVFAVLFALLGLGIYSMVSANVFRTADDQLLSTAQDADVMALDTVPDDVDGNADEEGEQALSETAYSLQQSIVESNPQFITLVRNEQGDLVDTVGLYASYPAFLEDVPFDPNDVDRIYQTETDGHAYRGITFLLDADEPTYLQVLVGVDAELAILDGFTRTLVLYLAAAVVAAAAASYLLSRRTLRPIVQNWKAQTEFVQNASHELRTPLAIILAAQERLLAEPGARIVDRFEDVGAVADETKRLARLVDDLMTLTSADASTEDEREAAPLEVGGIVEDVAGLYADVAEVAGKTLTVAVRPAGEVRIEADALRQVLGILLDNALKYTVAGDSVAVRCEERGARVTLSVADTGCGIDPADRGRVFERFYRADTARTTPGSGLGLSIARALVEHAGGVVAIEANEPRGTCVTVVLPKARAR